MTTSARTTTKTHDENMRGTAEHLLLQDRNKKQRRWGTEKILLEVIPKRTADKWGEMQETGRRDIEGNKNNV